MARQRILRERIESQFKKYKYPEDGYSKIKMFLAVRRLLSRHDEQYQPLGKNVPEPRLEFVVNQSIYMEGETKFADLVLPACSNFERWDIGEWASPQGYGLHKSSGCNRRIIVFQKKCIEPLGESKSDYEIFAMAAESSVSTRNTPRGASPTWTG